MRLPHDYALKRSEARRGAAAVELAMLLPLLVFCALASVDFARAVYVQITLQSCARNGGLYELYKAADVALPTSWTSLTSAVNADVPSGMTVSANATSPASSANNSVTVTTTTTYQPLVLAPVGALASVASSLKFSQSITMPYPNGTAAVP